MLRELQGFREILVGGATHHHFYEENPVKMDNQDGLK